MEEQLEALRRLIAQNKHIVFLEAQVYQQKVGFQTSEVRMACIGSITTSRRKFCLAIPIL